MEAPSEVAPPRVFGGNALVWLRGEIRTLPFSQAGCLEWVHCWTMPGERVE